MEKNKFVDWREIELGEIGRIVTGNTPPRNNSENYGNKIPWIKPPNLDKEKYVMAADEYLSEFGAKLARLLPMGAVLVSCIGNLGKIGIAGKELCTNQQINSIIPKKRISSEYLYYTIKKFQNRLEKQASSAVVPLLNKSAFSKIKIPLPFANGEPDLEEQQRIVAILEKAERLKEQGKKTNELLDEYLKSVFYEMFWNKGFENVEIGLISEILSRGRSPSYVPMSNLKIINQKCIYWESIKLDNIKYQDEKIKNSSFMLRRGDILINSTGTGTLGRAAVFNEEGEFTIDSHVTLLRPTKNLSSNYFTFYLKTEKGQEELYAKCVSGSTNQIELSRSKFAKLKIPLPPIVLQQKFASIVEKVEKMKENVKKTQVNTEQLFNSLMQKAFRGEI